MALLLNNFNKQKSDFDMKMQPVQSELNNQVPEPTRTRTLVDIELEADNDLVEDE
jgi:hypothetical protein